MIEQYDLKFTKSGPHLKQEDLEELERVLGLSLPPAYRDFLLEFNGGKPSPAYLAGPGCSTKVEYFLSVGHNTPHYNLNEATKSLQTERGLPASFLPIGCSSEEEYLVLDCSEDCSGSLYCWFDIEEGFRLNDPDFENLTELYFSVNELTRKFGPAKNRKDRDGMFCHLYFLSSNPQSGPKTARSLVAAGYDINFVLPTFRHPIFGAIDSDAYIVAETLLELGTDSTHLDPLHENSDISQRIEAELERWEALMKVSTGNHYRPGKEMAKKSIECLRRCAKLASTR